MAEESVSSVQAESGQIVSIPLSQIELDPNNPRKFVTQDMVEAIKGSFQEAGQITPIKVRPSKNGGYILIGGEIRTRAARELGWTEIKALILNVDEDEAYILAVIDNRGRQIHWFALYESMESIRHRRPYITQEQIGKIVGERQSVVSWAFSLLGVLSKDSREIIYARSINYLPTSGSEPYQITEKALFALSALAEGKNMYDSEEPARVAIYSKVRVALELVLEKKLSPAQTEALVAWMLAGNEAKDFQPETKARKPKTKKIKAEVPASAAPETIDPAPSTAVPVTPPLPDELKPSSNGTGPVKNIVKSLFQTLKAKLPHQIAGPSAGQKSSPYFILKQILDWIWYAISSLAVVAIALGFVWSNYQHFNYKAATPQSPQQSSGASLLAPQNPTHPPALDATPLPSPQRGGKGADPSEWGKVGLPRSGEGNLGRAERPAPTEAGKRLAPNEGGNASAPSYLPAKEIPISKELPSNPEMPVWSTRGYLRGSDEVSKELLLTKSPQYVLPLSTGLDAIKDKEMAKEIIRELDDATAYSLADGGAVQKVLLDSVSIKFEFSPNALFKILGGFEISHHPRELLLQGIQALHANQITVDPATNPENLYQCGLVAGGDDPVVVRSKAALPIQKLASAFSLLLNLPCGSMPYLNQGMDLDTGKNIVRCLFAGSPAEAAGLKLGDIVWSFGENADKPQDARDISARLSMCGPGSYSLYVVNQEGQRKARQEFHHKNPNYDARDYPLILMSPEYVERAEMKLSVN
jgi:ParB/RepB/Spo0J family partition protein